LSALRVQGRLRAAAALNVGMAIVALGLAWALLPPLGIAGAGWAWLASQVAGCLAVGLALACGRAKLLLARVLQTETWRGELAPAAR
jgi:Na+-driven multidrug efflux pump